MRYVPFDEMIGTGRMRVLRALRYFDRIDIADLNDACGCADESRMRAVVQTALRVAIRRGEVAHDIVPEWRPWGQVARRHYYRITPLGRAAIAQAVADYTRRLEAA